MDQGATQLLGSHLLVWGGEAGDPPGLCAGSRLDSGSLYLALKGMPYKDKGKLYRWGNSGSSGLCRVAPVRCALSLSRHVCSSRVDTSVTRCGTMT